MQIATHILAYNVNSSIKEVIENISPHVDKIFIAYPKRPWAYKLTERNNRQNPTSLDFILECSKAHNIKFKTLSLKEKTDNFIYDVKHLPRHLYRKIKKKII